MMALSSDRGRLLGLGWVMALSVGATGCLQALGLGDYKEGDGGGGGSTSSNPTTTSSMTTTNVSGSGTTTSGQSSSSGGCNAGDTQPCYDGTPATTAGVGECKQGTQACVGGVFADTCDDEVVPTTEDPQTWNDENCALDTSELVIDKGFGSPSDEEVNSLHVFSDGSFVAGGFTNGLIDFGGTPISGSDDFQTAWLARFDANMNHVWSVSFPNFNPVLHFASFDEFHGYFTGSVQVDTTFVGTTYPADTNVLVEIDLASGAVTQAHSILGAMRPTVVDSSQLNGVVRGTSMEWKHFSGVTAGASRGISGGSPLSAETFGGDFNYSYLFGRFTDTLTIGSVTAATGTGTIPYIAKIKQDGSTVQAVTVAVNGTAAIAAATYDTSGVYVVGTFTGSLPNPADPSMPTLSTDASDVFVARYINVGTTLTPAWAKGFPGTGDASPLAIGTAADGTVLISVQLNGPSNFGSGVLPAAYFEGAIAAYDPSGNPLYSRLLDAYIDVFASAMSGDTYAGCAYFGTAQGGVATGAQAFGGPMLDPHGAEDVCFARLAAPAALP